MPGSRGLSHIAMSVPPGTLTDAHRAAVGEFYGAVLGWREIESLRLADRLTFSVGGGCYLNIRERDDSMRCTGYEHVGVLLGAAEEVDLLWAEIAARAEDVRLEPIRAGDDGFRSFSFQHLLPLAIEVQHLPALHAAKRALPG